MVVVAVAVVVAAMVVVAVVAAFVTAVAAAMISFDSSSLRTIDCDVGSDCQMGRRGRRFNKKKKRYVKKKQEQIPPTNKAARQLLRSIGRTSHFCQRGAPAAPVAAVTLPYDDFDGKAMQCQLLRQILHVTINPQTFSSWVSGGTSLLFSFFVFAFFFLFFPLFSSLFS